MKRTDLTILLLALVIAAIGIASIYSSVYQEEDQLAQVVYRRQILWVVLGLIAFLAMSRFNYRILWDWTYFLYGLVIFLLSLVFILGIVRLGAQRWLRLAWFNIQPSELAKLFMVILIARYFSTKSTDDISPITRKFGIFRSLVFPLLLAAIPMGLIVEQPDLGSAVMIFLVLVAMLFISGVRSKYVVIFLSAILLCAPVLWSFLRDYQKQRLMVFINPNIDPLGAGYTVIQSKIAIGSGGLFGKGWFSGTQSQLNFLPESHTDFIFATFIEEWGFLGGILLLFLYYLLIRQGLAIAQRTDDYFGKLLAYGISLMLCFQIIVNLAMNMGLAPVVGLPLPLMSYGGSSVVVTFMALGILVNIEKSRSLY